MSKRSGSSGGGRRGLFDPSKMRARPANADAIPTDVAVTVTQLTGLIRGAIQASFPDSLDVVGELSNISRPGAGHMYFTLKDAGSEIRCVMWRSDLARMKFDVADGMEVIATGSVDVYEPRGQLQFYVKKISPRGVGALELAFQQLKDKLQAEGLFDAARKQTLPRFPKTVAVITSGTGAAIKDVLDTLRRRYPVVRVVTVSVRVQGDGAANEIANAIKQVNRAATQYDGIDAMIVGRGGGSIEDLWAFNEEAVARAIAGSKIPIISAVGHETDFTIADFVADVRAATPTAAAELVVPVRAELLAGIAELQRRIRRSIHERITDDRRRIDVIARTRWLRDPIGELRQHQQRLDELAGRLRLGTHRRLDGYRRRIALSENQLVHGRPSVQLSRRRMQAATAQMRLTMALRTRLTHLHEVTDRLTYRLRSSSPQNTVRFHRQSIDQWSRRMRYSMRMRLKREQMRAVTLGDRLIAASPEAVLKRGYTITRKRRSQEVVRSTKQLRDGDRVVTLTADGRFESRVVELQQGELFE